MTINDYKEKLYAVQAGYAKMRTRGYDILLEYSEEQKCFHFNFIDKKGILYDPPTQYFMPIGYINSEDYQKFRRYCDSRGFDFNAPLSEYYATNSPTLKEVEDMYKTFMYIIL